MFKTIDRKGTEYFYGLIYFIVTVGLFQVSGYFSKSWLGFSENFYKFFIITFNFPKFSFFLLF